MRPEMVIGALLASAYLVFRKYICQSHVFWFSGYVAAAGGQGAAPVVVDPTGLLDCPGYQALKISPTWRCDRLVAMGLRYLCY
ncbi:hypothetical protein BZA77DRAFT_300170 [Pyronema omphalodes]|nr:hypothetical protein BZA77DRAFT_300170 [Pyronema omphalodes]